MDKRRLIVAICQADLSPIQVKMATILFVINGLDNAIEFINKFATTPGLTGDKSTQGGD